MKTKIAIKMIIIFSIIQVVSCTNPTSTNDISIKHTVPKDANPIDGNNGDINITAPTIDDTVRWKLVWEDEFEGPANSLPNSANWSYDIGGGGWGNNELQYYTNQPVNVCLDGSGNLKITALKTSNSSAPYTSARIKTKGKFEFKYGRVEARMKLPSGKGIWPAFWMLGANIDQVGWPNCGEIDIMEMRGSIPNTTLVTLHGPGYSGSSGKTNPYTLKNGRFDEDYHVFAVEWYKDSIMFYVDNDRVVKRLKQNISPWVFDNNFFIILNLAVGGTFDGNPNSSTVFPQVMLIDYVKVYSRKEETTGIER